MRVLHYYYAAKSMHYAVSTRAGDPVLDPGKLPPPFAELPSDLCHLAPPVQMSGGAQCPRLPREGRWERKAVALQSWIQGCAFCVPSLG